MLLLLYPVLEHHTNIQAHTVLKAGKGDRNAQADLYRQYSKAMFNICIRMTGNRSDAEDLLQDAFINAFESIGQLKEPAAFGGWLRRIVVNKCIRFSKNSVQWKQLEEDHNELAEETPEQWWMTIKSELIHEEIKNLPNGCRQVFVLYVLEDFGHKDIAENLGISESTSKSQYQRARLLLKERIINKI